VALIRVTDEAGLRRWHSVWRTTESFDYVGLPADPIEDLRPALDGPVSGEDIEPWLLAVGDDVVAAGLLRLPRLDNLTLANGSMFVHPDHRRRGHGRRLVRDLVDLARDRGRTRILFEVPNRTRWADPAPGDALARSIGARALHAEVRRLLDLSSLSPERLEDLHAEAAGLATGYATVGWRDHTPAELVDDMAGLLALMSTDPPQGELDLEPEVWDAERYRKREESILARRRTHLTVAARDDRTGQLVGFTSLGVPAGEVEVGYQWETIVRGDHRGHRLGLLLKAANLLALRRELPQVRYLNTWNAEANAQMVSVNERLGFQPMERWTEWGLDLPRRA
jgi:GNAT superfamily N-acetyltransferase